MRLAVWAGCLTRILTGSSSVRIDPSTKNDRLWDLLAFSRDQEVNIMTQLRLGIRLLEAQAHLNNGELRFYHTNYLLFDRGRVVDYLKLVKSFLDANPNEVLTLLFMWKPAFNEAGITSLAYVPPMIPIKQSQWPTLGEMINRGKCVVVFMDSNMNTTLVDFILPEFEMIWETPFSVTDPNFPCSVDRIHGPFMTEDHMYMINHSLNKDILDIIVSDPLDAATTNEITSIMDHVNDCASLGAGRAPTFILFNFVNIRKGLIAADILNEFAVPTNDTASWKCEWVYQACVVQKRWFELYCLCWCLFSLYDGFIYVHGWPLSRVALESRAPENDPLSYILEPSMQQKSTTTTMNESESLDVATTNEITSDSPPPAPAPARWE
ncbi:putative plc-like phosphodiesterase [Lyophyllum shimeji]|uniref:Plc-like phosphodiesterase n=1 Tax=Lyophyllum shimeji TaxID=47721 RepID=A0A9P3PVV5_LYOSH|nr:putative plc-like phosphodiesterase [Lyophyllum shimeji]